MGLMRAFRNLQGKFSNAIAMLNFQPQFNFSTGDLLFQLPQHNRYFHYSTAIATSNRNSTFRHSTAIPTFKCSLHFQHPALAVTAVYC